MLPGRELHQWVLLPNRCRLDLWQPMLWPIRYVLRWALLLRGLQRQHLLRWERTALRQRVLQRHLLQRVLLPIRASLLQRRLLSVWIRLPEQPVHPGL
jgi:hypothetical protein